MLNEEWEPFENCVSEIRVNQIHVNQEVGKSPNVIIVKQDCFSSWN